MTDIACIVFCFHVQCDPPFELSAPVHSFVLFQPFVPFTPRNPLYHPHLRLLMGLLHSCFIRLLIPPLLVTWFHATLAVRSLAVRCSRSSLVRPLPCISILK